MKSTRVFLFLAIYGISYSTSFDLPQSDDDDDDDDDDSSSSQIFEQKLDHFNKTDNCTWKQEYFKQDKYYKNGGPVYLWIGGVDKAVPPRVRKGYWVSHAEKRNAMLFSVAHRFHYYWDDMFDDKLAYLTVPQALEDFAAFIISMNVKSGFPNSTKWIVFGASYAGNLAAWMRAKYPNLVHGAVASSAPILAQMEFPDYLDNIEKSISSYNKSCKEDIAKANQKLDQLVQTKEGRKEIGKTYKICDLLDGSKLGTSYFMKNMVDSIATKIEYDLDNKNARKICDKMFEDVETKTPVQRYAALMEILFKDPKCIETDFKKYVKALKRPDMISTFYSGRSWWYQVCSEFGWFQTSGKKSKTFSKNLDLNYYSQLCSRVFNYDKNRTANGVANTNAKFGGLKHNVERTLFVHGSNDPWKKLGITSTKKNKKVNVIIIKGGTHSTDASYEHLNSENKARKAAIQKITKILDSWLKK